MCLPICGIEHIDHRRISPAKHSSSLEEEAAAITLSQREKIATLTDRVRELFSKHKFPYSEEHPFPHASLKTIETVAERCVQTGLQLTTDMGLFRKEHDTFENKIDFLEELAEVTTILQKLKGEALQYSFFGSHLKRISILGKGFPKDVSVSLDPSLYHLLELEKRGAKIQSVLRLERSRITLFTFPRPPYPVAIKRQHDGSFRSSCIFAHEQRMQLYCQGPGIAPLSFLGSQATIMPAYSGDLKDLRITTKEHACVVLSQMAQGVKTLHEKEIVHCDIKPGNYLFHSRRTSPPCSLQVHLADFEFAVPVGKLQDPATPNFNAPELKRGAPAAFSRDIWALGRSFFQVIFPEVKLFEKTPYEYEQEEYTSYLMTSLGEVEKSFTECEPFIKLILEMLSFKPEDRPKIETVFEKIDSL